MATPEFTNQLTGLYEHMMRYALRLTGNIDEAKDLSQDTYLKALACYNQFEESTNLQAWVFTIMKNIYINNYRRHIRQNTTFDYTVDFYFLNQNRDTIQVEPDSIYNEKEIIRTIEGLDARHKVPFQMHIDGYMYKEIAEGLGLNLGTVKSRISATRKQLSIILIDYY